MLISGIITMVNYKNKNCELCGKEYTPTSPKQKYCIKCREEGRKIADRKRDRKRNRKKYNYKEYNRVCPSCGKEFTTHYSKKIYCGKPGCESCRIETKNKIIHINRDKQYLIDKGKRYYKENKELCCLKKAEAYREKNPDAKPYLPGRVYKHSIAYVKKYVEKFGYELLSTVYINNREKIKLKCPEGHEWETTFHNFKDCENRCAICYQQNNYVSKPELKIRELFENKFPEIEVLYNDRSQIGPKELDLFLPEYSLAIEVCGLYWHSDTANGVHRRYHYDKMTACEEKGIRLITIFEDELNNKFELVCSRIKQAIGKVNVRVYARKCELKEVPSKVAKSFFNDNHIQGACPAKNTLGLYYCDELVAAMSVGGVTRNHANLGKTLELKRFCSIKGTAVVGGASKLFKYVINYAADNNYDNIKSYCDMRYANIFKPVYELLGFELFKFTKYTPHYFKSGVRYRNMSLRKTPEERLTGKTELELRLAQGYNRIWDCGHRTYLYTLN
jgi:hypothetical protein